MRFLPALLALGLLSAATNAPASCRWFGTQVVCGLGGSQLSIGTQTAVEPTYAAAVRPLPFNGSPALLDNGMRLGGPFRLELQNIRVDPSLCRKIGNEAFGNVEAYCY
jgi:hypothetical protein